MTCQYCQCQIESGEATTDCPTCQTPYHEECWAENGGCSVYGCIQAPEVLPRTDLETPVGYWGQEKKNCPACDETIQVAAVRCRKCGQVFKSSDPLSPSEYELERATTAQKKAELLKAIAAFIVCVIPFLAPLGLIVSATYYLTNRSKISRFPTLVGALYKISIGVATLQILFLAIIAIGYLLRAA